jgi:tetratricopeptide (TPR) repeat protein
VPAAVRRDLLCAAGQAGTLLGRGRRVAASMVDQALERLTERSLLDFSLDGLAVSVHGLVARVVRGGLARQGHLAAAYQAAGRAAEAIPLLEQTLAGRERLLGPDHPDTMRSRNNLARAYREAGRISDAIPLVQQTLAARERLLGPDHPSTLASRNNLASAYRATGHPAEAIPLFELTLAACKRTLGPDDPRTVATRNNLTLAYKEAGRAE